MIRVLIVEDSAVIRVLLTAIIENEEDFEVIGLAKTGLEAIEMAADLNPDLITMDIRMPVMDGITSIHTIMSTNPKPIVVISSNIDDELQIGFRAIDEGALAVLEKPCSIYDPKFSSIKKDIVDTIRCMAEVKLVKRRIKTKSLGCLKAKKSTANYKLVTIGSSTGGPQALKQILASLPGNYSSPIVITQHISKGFIEGLAEWLNETSELQIKVATNGEQLQAGTVYFAPDNYHCQIQSVGSKLHIELCNDKEVNGFMPSVSRLFYSVATSCSGHAIGIILSGMGDDGADGLLAMHNNNCYTIAQDEHTSIVFGMPNAAIKLKAVNRVLPVKEICNHLLA